MLLLLPQAAQLNHQVYCSAHLNSTRSNPALATDQLLLLHQVAMKKKVWLMEKKEKSWQATNTKVDLANCYWLLEGSTIGGSRSLHRFHSAPPLVSFKQRTVCSLCASCFALFLFSSLLFSCLLCSSRLLLSNHLQVSCASSCDESF